MMLLHFLQRILKTLPWTLSSEIEYLAWQASQTIFMGGISPFASCDPQVELCLGEKIVPRHLRQTSNVQRIYANGSVSRMVSARSGPTEIKQNGTPASRSTISTYARAVAGRSTTSRASVGSVPHPAIDANTGSARDRSSRSGGGSSSSLPSSL